MIQEDGEIDLKDVEILELLKKSEYSAIFKVLVHETTCVMKVASTNLKICRHKMMALTILPPVS